MESEFVQPVFSSISSCFQLMVFAGDKVPCLFPPWSSGCAKPVPGRLLVAATVGTKQNPSSLFLPARDSVCRAGRDLDLASVLALVPCLDQSPGPGGLGQAPVHVHVHGHCLARESQVAVKCCGHSKNKFLIKITALS